MQVQTLGYAISGTFALVAVILSGWQIWTHLIYNPSPKIRRSIVRILMMVPIYSMTSWLALVLNQQKLLFETVRDCYEAFVLYSFYEFLVEYLGGKAVLANTLRSKPQVPHQRPCRCCLTEWRMGSHFLQSCSIGILQYIPIKVLMSGLTFLTSWFGLYGEEGDFTNPWRAYPYIVLVLNVSQGWALYCLVLFFLGTKLELAPIKPWPKFVAIKAIIFFTYWQSVIIALLQVANVITSDWAIGCPACWSAAKIASALNDFITCIEMLLFAIAHHYAFSIDDFLHLAPGSDHNGRPSTTMDVKAPLLANLMDAMNVTDVSHDLKTSRQEILTKKQALAAQFDRLDSSSPPRDVGLVVNF